MRYSLERRPCNQTSTALHFYPFTSAVYHSWAKYQISSQAKSIQLSGWLQRTNVKDKSGIGAHRGPQYVKVYCISLLDSVLADMAQNWQITHIPSKVRLPLQSWPSLSFGIVQRKLSNVYTKYRSVYIVTYFISLTMTMFQCYWFESYLFISIYYNRVSCVRLLSVLQQGPVDLKYNLYKYDPS